MLRLRSNSLATRHAKQRSSALVSARTSRLAAYMHDTLGPIHWADFVSHANRYYKATYVQAFKQQTLRCVGRTDGTPCPHAFEVDMCDPQAPSTLQHLHLDHEHPVHLTCRNWIESLPTEPHSWDDGIDQNLLCHSLFGVRSHPVLGPLVSISVVAHADASQALWRVMCIRYTAIHHDILRRDLHLCVRTALALVFDVSFYPLCVCEKVRFYNVLCGLIGGDGYRTQSTTYTCNFSS